MAVAADAQSICQQVRASLDDHHDKLVGRLDGFAARQESLLRRLEAMLDPTSWAGEGDLASGTFGHKLPSHAFPLALGAPLAAGSARGASQVNRPNGSRAGGAEAPDEELFVGPQASDASEARIARRLALAPERATTDDLRRSARNMQKSDFGDDVKKWTSYSVSVSPKQRNSQLDWQTASELGVLAFSRKVLVRMVRSIYFDAFCGGMILANAVLIALETDYTALTGENNADYAAATHVLNLWYVCELCIRILASGWGFLCGEDWKWNWFDMFMVSSSLLDMLLESMLLSGLSAGRAVRSIRLFRVARVLRIARMAKGVREFRKMVFSLLGSVQTLVWSLLLIVFVIFCVGVFFTQSASEFLREHPGEHSDAEGLQASFGSLQQSMYSLFQAITSGRNWGELFNLLVEVNPLVMWMFLAYCAVCLLGVMNVVTAVYVESAMQSISYYKDMLIQEKMLIGQTQAKHMKHIFNVIDSDNSGKISQEEMAEFLDNPKLDLQSYFEAMDLSATDTHTLFALLDWDGSGSIDIDEFCDGCMRLRGEARSFDLHIMRYEAQRSQKRLGKIFDHVMSKLSILADGVAQIKRDATASRAALSRQLVEQRARGRSEEGAPQPHLAPQSEALAADGSCPSSRTSAHPCSKDRPSAPPASAAREGQKAAPSQMCGGLPAAPPPVRLPEASDGGDLAGWPAEE